MNNSKPNNFKHQLDTPTNAYLSSQFNVRIQSANDAKRLTGHRGFCIN